MKQRPSPVLRMPEGARFGAFQVYHRNDPEKPYLVAELDGDGAFVRAASLPCSSLEEAKRIARRLADRERR